MEDVEEAHEDVASAEGPVEDEEPEVDDEPAEPTVSNVVTPMFHRPAFAAPSWADEEEDAPYESAHFDDEPVYDLVSQEPEDMDAPVHDAVSPQELSIDSAVHIAVSPDADPLVDVAAAQELESLRSDMLAEVEALRAELATLRAMQSHAPFAQPAQSEIDPDALKDCFTLIEERLSSLEFRAEEQDAALRRVLTLLVDWVEQEDHQAGAQAVA